MMRLSLWIAVMVMLQVSYLSAQHLLIYMDQRQSDHLKAYGVAFWSLTRQVQIQWLLNYRGGSFLCPDLPAIQDRCNEAGVSYQILTGSDYAMVMAEIENNNMESVSLEKAPRVAVYTPPNSRPWDDAVTMALEYAGIQYDKIWDEEVLAGVLENYDWLHLHHEDFTGQYGKFWANYSHETWYINQQLLLEKTASQLGYKKVSRCKLAVVETIRDYIMKGGFLFAMCTATDTYDIALAAEKTDICDTPFDHDPIDPNYKSKLDFSKCLAFQNFEVVTNPYTYEHSTIDVTPAGRDGLKGADAEAFRLFDFSAKFDPVPSMLTQSHTSMIKGFMGQTTGFRKKMVKPAVVILAEQEGTDIVKYIHGNVGKGFFTFLGGHDPEDYQHFVGDPHTDLGLHKNSAGYRLILNNILFPAAKKQKLKT